MSAYLISRTCKHCIFLTPAEHSLVSGLISKKIVSPWLWYLVSGVILPVNTTLPPVAFTKVSVGLSVFAVSSTNAVLFDWNNAAAKLSCFINSGEHIILVDAILPVTNKPFSTFALVISRLQPVATLKRWSAKLSTMGCLVSAG